MSMRRIGPMLVAGLLGLATGALAQDAGLEVQKQGATSFVSGGIGSDESQAIRAMRAHYNLHLLFAVQGTGEYLADVDVRVTGGRGEEVLQTRARGPFLLAQVPPGPYTVTASFAGKPMTRKLTVPATGAADQAFYWTEPPAR